VRIRNYAAAWLVCAALFLTACAGTRLAYKAADTPVETASVVAEHYYALVKEAADLRTSGALAGGVLEKVQAADRVAKPLVIGDPTATPPKAGLRQLADAYTGVKSAENEIALQAALTKAVLAVNDFATTVKEARR
jgi:hypothetical protein